MEAPKKKGSLSAEFIADLMANTRTRNQYGPKLLEFFNSDEAGINPAEAWPLEFGNKKPATLYQGFVTALNKAGEDVRSLVKIKKHKDVVFLLHTERVDIRLLELEDEDEE